MEDYAQAFLFLAKQHRTQYERPNYVLLIPSTSFHFKFAHGHLDKLSDGGAPSRPVLQSPSKSHRSEASSVPGKHHLDQQISTNPNIYDHSLICLTFAYICNQLQYLRLKESHAPMVLWASRNRQGILNGLVYALRCSNTTFLTLNILRAGSSLPQEQGSPLQRRNQPRVW